ncbi:MAG: hypothetical protein QXX79_05855, partial [Candidatus Bathyarchaeia archaeon]
KHLSKLVKDQLQDYDTEALRIFAVLMDDFWSCFACQRGCTAAIGGGCIAVCFFTVGLACSICLYLLMYSDPIMTLGCAAACEYLGWCP